MHATFARSVFWRSRLRPLMAIAFLALIGTRAAAADLGDAQALYRTGKYDECARMIAGELENGGWTEPWRQLQIQTELARGKDAEALAAVEDALKRFPFSLPLHLIARDVYRFNNRDPEALGELAEIERLIAGSARRYSTPEGLVALGRYYLIKGFDARKVLDQCYDVVTKQVPDFVDAHLATAELALEKDDDALAADTLRKAPKAAQLEPHYHYLMARALSSEDRPAASKSLAEALKINPSHVDSLLLQADLLIDSEQYADADKLLARVLAVNPREPRAWAYRAVLAHLRSDASGEAAAAKSARKRWAANPEVDHLIGRKLSQKYRFAEGAERQRQALVLDPANQPAQLQLCQDLLRLGDEEAGWKLAAEIFGRDGYNVVAYNLITLRDRLAGFRTLERDGFIVRMEPREADLYGQRVLALLSRARKTLGEKYAVSLPAPVIVEIFPRKKEFAVRTFGLPGADGFLGVCFGRVITANSPASQGEHPSNWEAVLWHEFCHVVTLSKTHNKMPRWLSEGISVYEETREDASWGMAFQPQSREMILGDALTPLSALSSAFLAPKTALHLQFAYYESALAVEFLVQNFGLPALTGLLDDLGAGLSTNDSLPRRTKKTLQEIDRDFAAFARGRAEHIAADATWDEPELPESASSAAISAWLDQHPKSFPGWKRLGAQLVKEQQWPQAKVTLQKVKMLYPEYVGADNAYLLLATVYRRLGDSAAERQVLEDLVKRDGDASPAFSRLMELDAAAKDWKGVTKNAQRLLALNPLVPAPHRALASAADELGDRETAIAAYRAQAMLDDADPAEIHYRLARLLHQTGQSAAARHEILKSLEEAPRFAAAHQLFLELIPPASTKPGAPASTAGPVTQGAKP